MDLPLSFQKRIAGFNTYSCAYDPRFCYYLYVPTREDEPESDRPRPLVVAVHGIERAAEGYRNRFRVLADSHNAIIMAPLFPAGIIEPDRLTNFHHIHYHDIAYEVLLLKMVEEVGRRFPVEDRFYLHGFSAGGEFAAAFFYLYPERLKGVSVGTPGWVAYIDDGKAWPGGWGGLEKIFGRRPRREALLRVPVQIVAGTADLSGWPSQADQAQNRLERAHLLFENYRQAGLDVRLDLVPEVKHEGFKLLPPVFEFFGGLIRQGSSGLP